jgi:site-specific recombinase XerD
MTTPFPSHAGLDHLVEHTLSHLEGLGYAPGTIANYRHVYEAFLRFAEQEAETESLSTALVQRFLEHHEMPADWTETRLTFHQRHVGTVMRVLTEFALHGCFQRRSRIVGETKLAPPSLQRLLCGYEEFHVKHVQSSAETLRTRKRQITRFLHYLDAHGIGAASEIQPSCFSNFLMSRAHLKPATLAGVVSAMRSFVRYLCMQAEVSGDLIAHIPKVRVPRDARIPSVWSSREVDALLNAVDRSSPVGKRDYAILLLAVRLGMRVSDVRALRLEHLQWQPAWIAMTQTKGGRPLQLPLTEEIGSALIDYLRNGRPKTPCREVFLRANAPFAPFASNNNLHNIVTTYRRRAGIALPAPHRHGLHSLRHTLASRLLEAETPLETISSIMGHVSVETTRIYTKIDIEALRRVAIDLEEVTHA